MKYQTRNGCDTLTEALQFLYLTRLKTYLLDNINLKNHKFNDNSKITIVLC